MAVNQEMQNFLKIGLAHSPCIFCFVRSPHPLDVFVHWIFNTSHTQLKLIRVLFMYTSTIRWKRQRFLYLHHHHSCYRSRWMGAVWLFVRALVHFSMTAGRGMEIAHWHGIPTACLTEPFYIVNLQKMCVLHVRFDATLTLLAQLWKKLKYTSPWQQGKES